MSLLYKCTLATFCCILFFQCSTYQVSDMQYHGYAIADSVGNDAEAKKFIDSYKEQLQAEMQKQLVFNKADMLKSQPESELGNFMANVCKNRAEAELEIEVDLALLNYGGIRIRSLSSGWVTKSKIYELMPFDNLIVAQKIRGDTLQMIFNQIADFGGWPISGAGFIIKGNEADSVFIGNLPLKEMQHYTIATSDYLANGGDKMDLLTKHKQLQTGVLLRDALMDFCENIHQAGDSLLIVKNKRVIKQ